MQKQFLISLGALLFMFIVTAIVIIYAKGYQIDFQKGKPEIAGTGLLVVTSNPDGAEVFINDHLTTATNNTINLAPGTYNVKIAKDGYFPWQKTIKVDREVVSKAEALLFPTTPKLESITDMGVGNPVLDPSETKIAFTVASQSAKKNGIYILNMENAPLLTLTGNATQIADDTIDTFSQATLSWAPDGQNLLATLETPDRKTVYVLSTGGFNNAPKDVTETLTPIQQQWTQDTDEKATARINSLKPELKKLVTENFTILSWSPDETKILYTASQSATLPMVILPALIGSDSMQQVRNIQKGNVYVYDIKEDRNYLIVSKQTDTPFKVLWYPDSLHLFYVHDKKVDIMDYDGGNQLTIYAGPFLDSYVFPWPSGNKFVILTNLGNDTISPNLYTVGIR